MAGPTQGDATLPELVIRSIVLIGIAAITADLAANPAVDASELESILDIIVVDKYKKDEMTDGERFMVSMSDQSLSNKLGMLELAKVICLKHGQEEEYFE